MEEFLNESSNFHFVVDDDDALLSGDVIGANILWWKINFTWFSSERKFNRLLRFSMSAWWEEIENYFTACRIREDGKILFYSFMTYTINVECVWIQSEWVGWCGFLLNLRGKILKTFTFHSIIISALFLSLKFLPYFWFREFSAQPSNFN